MLKSIYNLTHQRHFLFNASNAYNLICTELSNVKVTFFIYFLFELTFTPRLASKGLYEKIKKTSLTPTTIQSVLL